MYATADWGARQNNAGLFGLTLKRPNPCCYHEVGTVTMKSELLPEWKHAFSQKVLSKGTEL